MERSPVIRGSIVLVRFPFTDLTSSKVRPAVIVTPDFLIPRLDDLLCLFISSAMPEELLPTDLALGEAHPSFRETGLKSPSVFRTHKLALIHKRLVLRVLRVLGKADRDLMGEINARLQVALGLAAL